MKLTADSFDGTCKRPVKTWLHLTLAVTVKTKPDVNPDKQMIQSIERKNSLIVTGSFGAVTLFRGIFKTLSTSKMEILQKQLRIEGRWLFSQIAPPYIFDMVLNMHLKIQHRGNMTLIASTLTQDGITWDNIDTQTTLKTINLTETNSLSN